MKKRYTISALFISSCLLSACDRTPAERQAEIAEQREELRERQAEVAEQQREELREKAQEARYANPAPPSTARRGLEAATVQQIAEARCAREQKCGNVGADKDYATAEACRMKITADWAEEVNAYDCPGGVDQNELSQCLESIRNEDCSSPFDTLGRVVACRSGKICRSN